LSGAADKSAILSFSGADSSNGASFSAGTGRPIAWRKAIEVDTRRHDHDLRVACAVVAVELRCFVAGAGCQHVGFADYGGLAALPYVINTSAFQTYLSQAAAHALGRPG
jgi:hypothetical protein